MYADDATLDARDAAPEATEVAVLYAVPATPPRLALTPDAPVPDPERALAQPSSVPRLVRCQECCGQVRVLTLIRALAERVDVRRLDNAGAALDDACGLAEVPLRLLVASEVLARTSTSDIAGWVGNLRFGLVYRRQDREGATHEVGGHRVDGCDGGRVGDARVDTGTLVGVESGVEIVERHGVIGRQVVRDESRSRRGMCLRLC